MPKVFILGGDGPFETVGVWEEAATDYRHLVELSGIAPKGDAIFYDFQSIAKIPDHSIILVAPGSAFKIHRSLEASGVSTLLDKHFNRGVGYIGGCAGAVMASSSVINADPNMTLLYRRGLDIIDGSSYVYLHNSGIHIPYKESQYHGYKFVAPLSYARDKRTLHQAYLGGPGFVVSGLPDTWSIDANHSVVNFPTGSYDRVTDLAVNLSQPARGKRGAVALFGCHPELAVPDSKGFVTIKDGEPGFTPFSAEDIRLLEQDAGEVVKRTSTLLSSLFSPEAGSAAGTDTVPVDCTARVEASSQISSNKG